MKQKLIGVLKLSRIRETAPVALVLSILGAFVANTYIEPSQLFLVTLANLFSIVFSFMINDVEDAEDDAMDPKKVNRNPVSAKMLTKTEGYAASITAAVISLILFSLFNSTTFITGIFITILGFLYSWKKVRLKNLPVLDILSHGLFLGGLMFLASYFVFAQINLIALLVATIVTLASFHGDLNNEVRDYEVDRKSNLKNTASLFGLERTIFLKNLLFVFIFLSAIVAAIYLISYAFIPAFLGGMLVIGALVIWAVVKEKKHLSAISTDYPDITMLTIGVALLLSIYL